jgi:hypothetical protein
MSDTDLLQKPLHLPSSAMGRWIMAGWVALIMTPVWLWLHGAEARLTLLAVVACLAGWIFLAIGWNRDPNMEGISRYARSRSAVVLVVAVALFLQILGFGISVQAMWIAVLVGVAGFLGLWALSSTEERLRGRVNNLLVLSAALFFMAGAGEFLLSLTPVAARLLPPAFVHACREAWERQNYDRLWEKNVHHFRSLHLDESKGEGVFRIVTLGDSFTWGDKIGSTRDTWPYVLEKNCESQPLNVQVINLAKCGFTTVNELEMLNRFGWEFKPDAVIVQYFLNDPLPSSPDFQSKGEDWLQAPTWPLLPYLHQTLSRDSYLYSLLDDRFSNLQRRWRGLKNWTYTDLFADDFSGWQDNQRAFRELARIGREKVPVLLVLFPSFQGRLEDNAYPFLVLHQKVLAAAANAGLPALDLRPLYARVDPRGPSWWAMALDTHPGVRAQAVAAEAIGEELRRLGWLPSGKKTKPNKSK